MKRELRYGRKIQDMREAKGWTQEQLAEVAGVTTRTVQRVETDTTSAAETLQAIASAFDVNIGGLATVWLVPESKLIHSAFVASHVAFANADSRPSHAGSWSIASPLTEEEREHVDHLVDEILADRDCISPSESELWGLYLKQVKEPLSELLSLGHALFLMDESKDQLLRNVGGLAPEKPYIEDWRVRHIVVVPLYGCFQVEESAPMHSFDAGCPDAARSMFEAITRKGAGALVYQNALPPLVRAGSEDRINWCDHCFPRVHDGLRVSFEYIAKVTGRDVADLYVDYQERSGNPFIEGLA